MRERLLTIHMLARANAGHRRDRVNMVGCADRHGVNTLVFLIEHLAKVFVTLRARMGRERRSSANFIDIAKRNNVSAELGECRNVDTTHGADTNSGDVYPFTGRHLPCPAEYMSRHNRETK